MQAYLDSIQAKTGKTPDDFRVLAAEKSLVKHAEIIAWLKADFGLGHGHANAIAHLLRNPDAGKVSPDDKLDKLFVGNKAAWRKTYDALLEHALGFGADVRAAPTQTYVSLLRGSKKFAIVQPSALERLDLGLKLRGFELAGLELVGLEQGERLEAAGSWNAMVTHRVRISDPTQVDAQVLEWLRQAYEST